MRLKYQLPVLTKEQRMEFGYLLHHEVENQNWFAIAFLKLWKSQGLICTQ